MDTCRPMGPSQSRLTASWMTHVLSIAPGGVRAVQLVRHGDLELHGRRLVLITCRNPEQRRHSVITSDGATAVIDCSAMMF